MCSFTVTNSTKDLKIGNTFSKRRGPDHTEIKKINGIQFLHNLLHITGTKKIQPFIEDDIVCVLNGEIYNFNEFGTYESDGECIIPLYKEFGLEFAKKLNGEFAICIVDFKQSNLIVINDTFATKPIWMGTNGREWGIASYESSLSSCGLSDIEKLPGNHAWRLDLDSFIIKEQIQLKEFDLRQYKDSYDDWIAAFETSIRKRTQHTSQKIFLGLSAGYDSGAISCALTIQNIDYKAYTILSNEDRSIIDQRHVLLSEGDKIGLSRTEFNNVKLDIESICEEFVYNDQYKNYNIKHDKASVGLGAICSRANLEGRKIYLSGQGADEIISDYGYNGHKIYDHSSFGGKFPNDLSKIFPWHSFYDGTQVQYLNKEEYVAGAYGIETRYPFLDVDLVQEFLWLHPYLKNRKYKAPLDEYMTQNKYPFQQGIKTGFQASSNLI